MKPTLSLLDRSFIYRRSEATSVEQTWRKHGWLPLEERQKAKPVLLLPMRKKEAKV